ncbi:hypothetical protein pb186bvf_005489 [Paramecium bursaria]
MINLLIFIIIKIVGHKIYSKYRIALIDTDCETIVNKINCTEENLKNIYNHADETIGNLNNKNIQLYVVGNRIIKQSSILRALNMIHPYQYLVLAIMVDSLERDPQIEQRIYELQDFITIMRVNLSFDENMVDCPNIINRINEI